MALVRVSIVTVLVVIGAVLVKELWNVYDILQLPEEPVVEEEWWTDRDPSTVDDTIRHFRINVSQDTLDDLHYRLDHTRPLPIPLENNQRYGFNGKLAGKILSHWKTQYDWKKRETYLNKFPQFVTNIQGLDIHFLHVKPNVTKGSVRVFPLLILHGWPGSVREFYEMIPLLTTPREDRDFVFEVVAPHLPGFAFSEAPTKPGLGAFEVALVMKNLMNRLGFKKFFTQGGDLGSLVLQAMAVSFEDAVIGFHSNMCLSIHPWSWTKLILGKVYPPWVGHEWHQKLVYPLSELFALLLNELGYMFIQSSKPDSLGIAMDDSPMGLAAYYLEKFSTGGGLDNRLRPDGGLKQSFRYDDLLDNVMLYWINKSATTAFRFYAEIFNRKNFKKVVWIPVKIPTVCARFKHDFVAPDGVIRDIYWNLVQVNDYDGGHFAALEFPERLAGDIFEGISKISLNETVC